MKLKKIIIVLEFITLLISMFGCIDNNISKEQLDDNITSIYKDNNLSMVDIKDIEQKKNNGLYEVTCSVDLINDYSKLKKNISLVYFMGDDKEYHLGSYQDRNESFEFIDFDVEEVIKSSMSLYDDSFNFEIISSKLDKENKYITGEGSVYTIYQSFYAKSPFSYLCYYDMDNNAFNIDKNNITIFDGDSEYVVADISCHFETKRDDNIFLNRDLSFDIVKDGNNYSLNNMYIYDSVIHGQDFTPIVLDFKYDYIIDSDEAINGMLENMNPDTSPYIKPGLIAVLTYKPENSFITDHMVFYILDNNLYFISGMGYGHKNPQLNAYSFSKKSSNLIKGDLHIELPINN